MLLSGTTRHWFGHCVKALHFESAFSGLKSLQRFKETSVSRAFLAFSVRAHLTIVSLKE
jgi:hypothetical protein